MKCFCQHAEFITGGTNYPGGLSQCALDTDEHEMGFLSLLRLIGTAYFKRCMSLHCNYSTVTLQCIFTT